jgi:ribonuclease HI
VSVRATLRFDGGRRPSINTAAYGFTLTDAEGNPLTRSAQAIGDETHNVAEYRGLIAGLSCAAELGINDLQVRGDSKVVIFQMSGEWKAPRLAALRDEARRVASRIGKVEYIWNRRDENVEADKLVNLALDGYQIQPSCSPLIVTSSDNPTDSRHVAAVACFVGTDRQPPPV